MGFLDFIMGNPGGLAESASSAREHAKTKSIEQRRLEKERIQEENKELEELPRLITKWISDIGIYFPNTNQNEISAYRTKFDTLIKDKQNLGIPVYFDSLRRIYADVQSTYLIKWFELNRLNPLLQDKLQNINDEIQALSDMRTKTRDANQSFNKDESLNVLGNAQGLAKKLENLLRLRIQEESEHQRWVLAHPDQPEEMSPVKLRQKTRENFRALPDSTEERKPPKGFDSWREFREQKEREKKINQELLKPADKASILKAFDDIARKEFFSKINVSSDIDKERAKGMADIIGRWPELFYYRGLVNNWTLQETKEYLKSDMEFLYDKTTGENWFKEGWNFIRNRFRTSPGAHPERSNPHLKKDIAYNRFQSLKTAFSLFAEDFKENQVDTLRKTQLVGGKKRWFGLHDIPLIGRPINWLASKFNMDFTVTNPFADRVPVEDIEDFTIPFEIELLALKLSCASAEIAENPELVDPWMINGKKDKKGKMAMDAIYNQDGKWKEEEGKSVPWKISNILLDLLRDKYKRAIDESDREDFLDDVNDDWEETISTWAINPLLRTGLFGGKKKK